MQAPAQAITLLQRAAVALLLLAAGAALSPAWAGQAPPYAQGLLWRIDRPGIEPSHLFGTIHVTDPRVLDLPVPVRQAFEGARSTVFEVVMTDAVRFKLARAMVLTDGRTLDALIEPELFERTVASGARQGFSADQLRFFKPWALAVLLSVPREELVRGAAGALPLDQRLQAEARRLGKPVHELETADEQIALFDDLSGADQAVILASAVVDSAAIGAMYDELVRLYLARDIGAIHGQMEAQSAHFDRRFVEMFLLRFNETRNRTMAERMAAHLETGGAFIAVGALHLPGETGLLSLLAGSGYRVERVY